MQKRPLLFFYLIFLPAFLWGQSITWIEGSVFHDKNQNKVLDRGERGLKRVAVSNGRDIVYTDSKGYFRSPVIIGNAIFPILPNGYTLVKEKGEQVNNAYFYYVDSMATPTQKYDFALIAEKQPPSFRIGAIGDVQVGSTAELNYAAKSIFQELAFRQDIAFHIILGDLVNDQTDLLIPFKSMLQTLPASSWTLLGNHDRNTANTAHMDDHFNQHFGTSTYAFNYGGVHFIVLNNVFSTGKRSYEGRVSGDQLQFIANDLKTVPTNTPVVVAQHIPMRYTRNRSDVFKLLEDFSNVLILSGHTHQVSRHFYNEGRIQELVAGAPSGNWWTGEIDTRGIPEALMQCGTPRNYFTIDFDPKNYRINYKGIGLDDNQQMDLTLRGDTLITNLYGASDSTSVQVRVDDGQWFAMDHVKRPAESVLRVIENNKEKRFPASGIRINPLRKRISPHIWQVVIPQLRSPGVHKICIKAADQFGYTVENIEMHFVPAEKP